MYQSSAALSNRAYSGNAYLTNDILNASQEKLILKVYDFAIVNSKKGNLEKTNRAISVLISGLNFDDPAAAEIADGLMKLYQFCQEQTRKQNFEIVTKILTDLKESWLEAFDKVSRGE